MSLHDGPVGLLGQADVEGAVRAAADDLGRGMVTGPLEDVLGRDPAVIVVTDTETLSMLVADPPSVPILPVGIPETATANLDAVGRLIQTACQGEPTVHQAPLLSAHTPGGTVRALYDLSLMTAEPARISEYRVLQGGGNPITHMRADGVVIATPLGSDGYAYRTGGPKLGPDLDGLAVVPVSPFSVARDCHVVEAPIKLSVERDEGVVELHADGRSRQEVQRSSPLEVVVDATLPILSVDEKT